MAKVSVCPQALLALREQTRAFCQETRHALLNKDSLRSVEDRLEASEEYQVFLHVCPVKATTCLSLYYSTNALTTLHLILCHVYFLLTGKTFIPKQHLTERNVRVKLISGLKPLTLLSLLFLYTETIRRVSMSFQRTCKRHGRIFKSTPQTVWLLLLKVNMSDTLIPNNYIFPTCFFLTQGRRL